MQKFKDKFKGKNSDLIKSFLEIMGVRENYEVWAPYQYRGVLGFVDLVVKDKSKISIFKFVRDASKLEEAIKNLKLEREVYPKSEGTDKTMESFLVVADSDSNRESILSLDPLLKEQYFEILILNKEDESIESYFESKYSIRQLLKSEDIRIDDEGLEELISRENHREITRAILKMDDPPESVDKEFIRKIANYIKINEKVPDSVDLLESQEERSRESYRAQPDDVNMHETEQSW